MKVHQIYGLLDDGLMPQMFKDLQKKMIMWCRKNNYTYKLWNKKMCEDLLKKYPQYTQIYKNVKYKIMRVDIMRYLILHNQGGLYCDLDIEPKIKKLKDYDWAISSHNKNGKKTYDMEVIQSKQGNIINLHYLDYVKTQIIDKDKKDIYKVWKGRYVLHTTGPRSLTRFLNMNKINPPTYKVNGSQTNPPKLNLEGGEEFISYPSGSWLGKN